MDRYRSPSRRSGAVTGWHNDIKGASTLAVGSRAALSGGYGAEHDLPP